MTSRLIASEWRTRLLAAAWLATAVLARAQAPTGVVAGRVTDPSGGVMPGVTITLSGPGLVRPRTATTTIDGTFRLTGVPDGNFTLTAELSGFMKTTQHVSVERGAQVDLPTIKMEIGTVSEPNLERMGLTPDDIPLDVMTSLGRFSLAVRRGPAPAATDAFLKHLDAHFYDGGRLVPVVARDQSGQRSLQALALMERDGAADSSARVIVLANEQVAAGQARDVIGRVWHVPDRGNPARLNVIGKIFQEGPDGESVRSPIMITRAGRVFLMRP